ncbi:MULTISPECIES: WXG100 family type VII secretion target [Streptomyces]|uniref:WXG100 family type VII secretion target n=1 Tax=Streptomyces TaxID=1883 RepID=UPI00225BEC36|nr:MULTISPECIES: WXG100 family type VII secretion target [Streptomyces]MCX5447514.1 WXG100 family type VII secretion target [Streptomyces libani]MCX5447709.1 WXG100 family type VII secretion target [Streptomyces libani]WDT58823.1 WXG100 family type VII secretion target [Streptomyces sp. G7(2002)]
MSTAISVNFSALTYLTSELDQTLSRLTENLESVQDALFKIMESWEGDARDACMQRMDEWEASMKSLQSAQRWCHHLVTNGHSNYSSAHQAVMRGWGAA